MTAIAVVSSTGHVIDLPDAGHHGSWVPLLKGLTASGDQRLDGPAQQLLRRGYSYLDRDHDGEACESLR